MIVDLRTRKAFPTIAFPQRLEEKSTLVESAILRAATAFSQPETHANDVAVQMHLRALRAAQRVDCTFIILFDRNQQRIDRLIAPRIDWVVSDPQAMIGISLPPNALFKARFEKQQIVHINSIAECDGELQLLTGCMSSFNLKSLLLGGVVVRDAIVGLFVMGSSRASNQWQLDMQLTMRLMTATYGAGLERYLMRQSYYGVKIW